MENSDSDEPQRKRPHLNSVPPSAMARSSSNSPPPNNHSVDATVLQYQNQRLLQQIEKQKHDLLDLEAKIKELKDKQGSYDDMLITVNQLWNQLVDDLILLDLCAGGSKNDLQVLDGADYSRGSIPSCAAEEMFLCRLLQRDSIEANSSDEIVNDVEKALTLRHASTRELLKHLEYTIYAHRENTEKIAHAFDGKAASEDGITQLSNIDDMMEKEIKNLREGIDVVHVKQKEYADVVRNYLSSTSTDQSEIRRITGELDDSMAELEESRRKLVNLRMQKDVTSRMHNLTSGAVNGILSPEKSTERTISLREHRNSIEETKILAAVRLSEYEEAQEENLMLSKQLQDLQNELKDEKYVHSSRLYFMLKEQLQHWNAELDRYKALTHTLQADRAHGVRRENDLSAKVESADAVRNAIDSADSKIEELELQMQKCTNEKNDAEINMEEAIQDSGRKDIIAEFRVMASALSKEMGMMESQVERWKETAHETLALRDKTQSLKVSLSTKTNEQKSLADKCEEQLTEIKSLKALIENLQKQKMELQIFLDLYVQESNESRDLITIKESECKAYSQAEMFKNALDEHSLELRVKAAYEAETACQQRLSATEAEITALRAKLDASEREALELTEAIKFKDKEAEAYISEIETIGQAYENMQTQNQHLLQQVAERDDFNIKLVSETLKTKQAQSFILSDKQALTKQLQQVNTSVESLKMRISHFEEQMKAFLIEAIKSTEENRHLAVNVETAKWEIADADEELHWLKYALSSSEKGHALVQQDMNYIQLKLDNERSLSEDLDEELAELNSLVGKMSSETGEAAIQKLQSEIKFCKNILQCSVCTDRPKEVVIVKCYHLFCNYCVQKNLETRHRKCPACGTPFGQNDIRFVKI